MIAKVFTFWALPVFNFGRVAARPTPHRLAGLRLLSWISDSRQATAPRRSGVRGHNPALSGAAGHSPTTGNPVSNHIAARQNQEPLLNHRRGLYLLFNLNSGCIGKYRYYSRLSAGCFVS